VGFKYISVAGIAWISGLMPWQYRCGLHILVIAVGWLLEFFLLSLSGVPFLVILCIGLTFPHQALSWHSN